MLACLGTPASHAGAQVNTARSALKLAVQEEAHVLAGPRAEPEAFFESMEHVEAAVAFFLRHRCVLSIDVASGCACIACLPMRHNLPCKVSYKYSGLFPKYVVCPPSPLPESETVLHVRVLQIATLPLTCHSAPC